MSEALHSVAELVRQESGVVVRESQLPALRAAIARVAPGMDAEQLLREAQRGPDRAALVERLIDEVTIKETYFLRHREELDTIDFRALAAQAATARRSRIRAWSAACSSGEEPYSLALLALEAFAPEAAPIDVLATDIAASALERGRAGRYGARSVRHVNPTLRARWFAPHRSDLEVGPEVRERVRFARHNLLSDPIPPAGEAPFDLIVCRNVLIYFRADVVRQTIERLRSALVPGGTLLLGAADRLITDPQAARAARPARPPAPGERRRQRERRVRSREPRRERRSPPAPAAIDAAAELERGLAALAAGDGDAAVDALRRVLYLDPGDVVAAFQLARAHELRGDAPAARRSYWQALALLETAPDEIGGVSRDDLMVAARTRLDALSGE